MPDLFLKVMVLIVSFAAFDHFVGGMVADVTEGCIVADLLITLAIAAPFGFFTMSVMAIQRRLKDRLKYLSETDQLTGLPNRQSFLNQAAETLSKHPSATILMIDVDHFKSVNDKHGHFIGDLSLRRVGKHLVDCTRTGDIVGRIGGEEFAVILMNADPTTASRVSARICQSIQIESEKEMNFRSEGFELTMSVGGVTALPGQDIIELMRYADHALYKAKSSGRARVVFFEWDFDNIRVAV